MTTIASLDASLGVRSAQFERELKRAKRTLSRFGSDVKASFVRLGAATTAASAAFTALSLNALAAADDVIKAARNTGLAAEEYQKLNQIFKLSGSSTDSMVKSIQTLTRSIYEAGRGVKTYTDSLEDIGLSYEDLFGLSPDKQFHIVRDALRNVSDESTKFAVAQRLLGRGGREVGSILAVTNEEVKAIGDQLVNVGGIIKTDFIGGVEQLNDQMSTTSTVIKAQFTNALIEGLAAAGAFGNADHIIKGIGEAVNTATKSFIKFLHVMWDWREVIGKVAASLAALWAISFAASAVDRVLYLVGAIAKLGKGMLQAASAVSKLTLAKIRMYAVFAAGALVAASVYFSFKNSYDEITKTWSSLGDFFTSVFKGVVNAGLIFFEKFKREVIEFFDWATDHLLGGINTIIEKVNVGLAAIGKDPIQPFNMKGLGIADKLLGDIKSKIKDLNDENKKLADQAAKSLKAIGKGAAKIGSGIKEGFVGVFDSAKGLYGQFVDSITKDYGLTKDLLGSMSGGDGGVGSGGGGGTKEVKRLGDSFVDGIVGSLNSAVTGNSFKDFGLNVLTSVRNSLSRELFNDFGSWLKDSFAGKLSDLLKRVFSSVIGGSGSGGGGFLGALGSAAGALFGGGGAAAAPAGSAFEFGLEPALRGLQEFHTGGVVPGRAGQEVPILAMAGETVFTPDQMKSINKIGSGQTINQTFNVTGSVDDATRRAVRGMADEIASGTQQRFAEWGVGRG